MTMNWLAPSDGGHVFHTHHVHVFQYDGDIYDLLGYNHQLTHEDSIGLGSTQCLHRVHHGPIYHDHGGVHHDSRVLGSICHYHHDYGYGGVRHDSTYRRRGSASSRHDYRDSLLDLPIQPGAPLRGRSSGDGGYAGNRSSSKVRRSR